MSNLKPGWVDTWKQQSQQAPVPPVVVAPCPLEPKRRRPSSSTETSRLRGAHKHKTNQITRAKLEAALDFSFPEDEL